MEPSTAIGDVLAEVGGYEWLHVLAGELRLIIDHDVTMDPGEVVEFDTQVPHWFGPAGDRPVEILGTLGRDGERTHARAAPRVDPTDGPATRP
jgi:uncharacterized cupin superfamily protein